jgi:hypothetical protein
MQARNRSSFLSEFLFSTEKEVWVQRSILCAVLITVVLLLQAAFPYPVTAGQLACGDRTRIVAELEQHHAEKTKAFGVSSEGAVFEVLSSANGSWTLLVSFPDQETCVIAAGEAWETLPVVASGPTA